MKIAGKDGFEFVSIYNLFSTIKNAIGGFILFLGIIIISLGFFHIVPDAPNGISIIPKHHFTYAMTIISIKEFLEIWNNRNPQQIMHCDDIIDNIEYEYTKKGWIADIESRSKVSDATEGVANDTSTENKATAINKNTKLGDVYHLHLGMTINDISIAFPFIDKNWIDDTYVDTKGNTHIRDLDIFPSASNNFEKDSIQSISISFCNNKVCSFVVKYSIEMKDPDLWASKWSETLGIPSNWVVTGEEYKSCCRDMKFSEFSIALFLSPDGSEYPGIRVSSDSWKLVDN